MAKAPTAHTPVAPPLPCASIDFNSLHDAAVAGTLSAETVEQHVIADEIRLRELAEGEMLEDASATVAIASTPIPHPTAAD